MHAMRYVQPGLTLVLVLLAAGFLARKRGAPKLAGRLYGAAAVFLLLWSWMPVAALGAWTLERGYPQDRLPGRDAQAIVVLSSNFYAPNPPRPRSVPGWGTYLRCRHAAWLYREGWHMPVVASGGSQGDRVMAEIMRDALAAEGVPRESIWLEGESESTRENAAFSAKLLLPRGIRRIVLVTEAYHMRRAERYFRDAGFAVDPSPCAYRTAEFDGGWEQWVPNAGAIAINELTLHEWVGLAR
jgi:uncharacterized SAM-binding protein YcdF (DUF218 family)